MDAEVYAMIDSMRDAAEVPTGKHPGSLIEFYEELSGKSSMTTERGHRRDGLTKGD